MVSRNQYAANHTTSTAYPGGAHRAPKPSTTIHFNPTKEQREWLCLKAAKYECTPVDILRVLLNDAIAFPMVSESFFEKTLPKLKESKTGSR